MVWFSNGLALVIIAIQWGSEIQPFEIRKHLNSGLFEGRILNGPVFKWSGFSYSYSQPFENWIFLSRFQMVFDKMAAICSDFKWLGFWISDPIQKSGPFRTQPLFILLKSRLVRLSDPHCSDLNCICI